MSNDIGAGAPQENKTEGVAWETGFEARRQWAFSMGTYKEEALLRLWVCRFAVQDWTAIIC